MNPHLDDLIAELERTRKRLHRAYRKISRLRKQRDSWRHRAMSKKKVAA